MAIFRLAQDFFDTLTLEANPRRMFRSSSVDGVTGSVYLFAERSPIEKESKKTSVFNDRIYDEDSVDEFRANLVDSLRTEEQTNYAGSMEDYFTKVNQASSSSRKQKQLEIIRFTPSMRFTSDTLRKNVVRDVLFPYYRPNYPTLQWAYTNYHTLNFFTSSQVPTGSCLIYPASSASVSAANTTKLYLPSSSFTFDFYINPRYTTDVDTQEYHAGTLFHMSSSYAISLVSGSSVGVNGRPDGFRLMLQLSSSTDILPSRISLSASNNSRPVDDTYQGITTYNKSSGLGNKADLIFLSSDNSLKKNHWHHVGVRWAGTWNDGTGSFVIDGEEDATFVIPSASCMQETFLDPVGDPDTLFIGNFYNGWNNTDMGGLTSMFFNPEAAAKDGIKNLFGSDTSVGDPPVTAETFAHPLNAEVHVLKIYDTYRTLSQLLTSSASGSVSLEDNLIFYVPPYFVKETTARQVLQTPFQSTTTPTDDPFNVALSFSTGGHLMNLENFVREFVENDYPRLYNLTASVIDVQADPKPANTFLFATGSVRKRNLTLLPCDNGKLIQSWDLLKSGTVSTVPESGSLLNKYINDFGALDLSLISLRNLVSTSSLSPGLFQYAISGSQKAISQNINNGTLEGGRGAGNFRICDPDNSNILLGDYPDIITNGTLFEGVVGPTPSDPGIASGSILTILQRTRDNSSDEVVFFDISNMFYGNKIKPHSFSAEDSSVTGSGGKVSILLRDNGNGNLYRADALTKHAKWANVGDIIYEEGIAVIKSPNIPFFGKEQFEVNLTGEQNIHVLEVNVPCEAGMVNSSSNPAFQKLKPSDYASETADEFVYITGINFHDENLNVIARTNLAQPVVKRDIDRYKFRVKIDF